MKIKISKRITIPKVHTEVQTIDLNENKITLPLLYKSICVEPAIPLPD